MNGLFGKEGTKICLLMMLFSWSVSSDESSSMFQGPHPVSNKSSIGIDLRKVRTAPNERERGRERTRKRERGGEREREGGREGE